METQFTIVDGLKIRFAKSGGDYAETLVLLSPLPESILAFAPIWKRLSLVCNLLAIDLPGYGHSQGRVDLYSVRAMSEFLVQILDHFDLTKPHVVGVDIGCPVSLFTAALHPERIKTLIICGGASVYPLQVDLFLKDIIEATDLEPYKKVSPADAINSSLSELKNYHLPNEIRADYISSYADGRLFEAFQILRSFEKDLQLLQVWLDKLPVAVQIIWGRHDPIALVENAFILNRRLQNSKLNILNTGHYAWEEGWEEFAAIIEEWLEKDSAIRENAFDF
ncbi:MAG TPA: alpha/beta hydrolase [Puia sp.]|nr:alpha/beta hydrolase [Puia sp.]